jgi:D-alanine transaminase
MCNVKTLNLLPAVLASKKAEESGCDEAVFIRDGIVTECAHSNIFTVKDGIVYTHPKGPHILPGITRKRVLYFCEQLGIECHEKKFTKSELLTADEILVTSTTKLCVRADEIDKSGVGHKNRRSSIAAELIIKALEEDFLA